MKEYNENPVRIPQGKDVFVGSASKNAAQEARCFCQNSDESMLFFFFFKQHTADGEGLAEKQGAKQVLLNTMHSAHIITNKTNENASKRK